MFLLEKWADAEGRPRRVLKTLEIMKVEQPAHARESWLAGEGTQRQAEGTPGPPGLSPGLSPAPAQVGSLPKRVSNRLDFRLKKAPLGADWGMWACLRVCAAGERPRGERTEPWRRVEDGFPDLSLKWGP